MVKQFSHNNKLLIVGPYMGLYLGEVSPDIMMYSLEKKFLTAGFNVQIINNGGKNHLFVFKTEKMPYFFLFTKQKLSRWLDSLIEKYESLIQQQACPLDKMPSFSVPTFLSKGTPEDELFNSVRYAFGDGRIFVFHKDIRGKYIPFYEYGYLFSPFCCWFL
jgi:hypothetical protein